MPPDAVVREAPVSGGGPPAAFIDRDGVINEDLGYVHRPEDFRLLPGVTAGLRLLQAAGFRLVVVTNQAGIARGLYDASQYEALTRHMRSMLRRQGIVLDAVMHCPHHPSAGRGGLRTACECRKPAPGMLLRARDALGLDLAGSVLIGDTRTDLLAGRAAGLRRVVLVESGKPTCDEDRAIADAVCADLLEAASLIVTGAVPPGPSVAAARALSPA
jgi:D-glycero-D-manno-heptose 1,7-bisphosphate phosphatase